MAVGLSRKLRRGSALVAESDLIVGIFVDYMREAST